MTTDRERWIKSLICIGCATAGILISVQTLVAAPTSKEEEKILHIGGNAEFAPFEFINNEGQPDGYTVDLIKAVARHLGVKISINLGDWNQMRQQLTSRHIDVLTGVLYSEARDEIFDFSVPHMVFSYSIFIRKNDDYTSIEELKDKAVLVVKDVYAHDWLRTYTFTDQIFEVNSPKVALKMLSEGDHDFAVLPRLHGLDLMDQLKIKNLKTFGQPVLTQKFCFAVAEGDAGLLARLNEGLLLVQKSGEYDRIYLKWFSVYEQKKRWFTYVLRGGFGAFAILIVVLLWNLSLKKRVKHKTDQLHQSKTYLNQIIHGFPIPTFVVNNNEKLVQWNYACETLTGIPAKEVIGTNSHKKIFYKDDESIISEILLSLPQEKWERHLRNTGWRPSLLVGNAYEHECFFSHLGKEGKWLFGTVAVVYDMEGRSVGAIESWQDSTERKRLEAQLIQSQKMEALGTMAGGIAHDFGNILTVIMAHTEIMNQNTRHHQTKEALQRVMKATDHGKNLIRHLMMFARQTDVNILTQRIDLLIEEAIDLVRAAVPSSIQIHRHIYSKAKVAVDSTQLQQVVLNLCTNAAHAMAHRTGDLTISLKDVMIRKNRVLSERLDGSGSAFVKLSVTDTGHGVPGEIKDRIFDPFFTTKEMDQGSGMGLSVCLGIVRRFSGWITVESEIGKGASFHVFLPVADD
jgi:two-component system sensor histidine kinase EvgS